MRNVPAEGKHVSGIVSLIAPTFWFKALRFLRWRKRLRG
jgi:hypothetical protein